MHSESNEGPLDTYEAFCAARLSGRCRQQRDACHTWYLDKHFADHVPQHKNTFEICIQRHSKEGVCELAPNSIGAMSLGSKAIAISLAL